MKQEIIDKLQYSYIGQNEYCSMPNFIKDSLNIISEFFKNSTTNKLCIVFPTKEYIAQWLSIPTVLFLIESDYAQFKNEIVKALDTYKKGDWLILNNEAIVEWIGKNSYGLIFKHKEFNGIDSITIGVKDISKIQPAPTNRNALSGYRRVVEALNNPIEKPIDKILGIHSANNKLFQKNAICLISKHISFENSISDVTINNFSIDEYFNFGKIDEFGTADLKSPLLISNNFGNLALHLISSSSVAKIIIDGFAAIQERGTDFSDIDVKKIPTILITDLSEINSFEDIGNYGFEFFNFTRENLKLNNYPNQSPFNSINRKLRNYISFNLFKEICHNTELETIVEKIHSIEKDESNSDLNSLKISLVQLTNLISRVAHVPTNDEISNFNFRINKIESLFLRNKLWLGDSYKPIEESISLLKSLIEKFSSKPTEKCERLNALLKIDFYDYVICPTEEEAKVLNYSLCNQEYKHSPRIISMADVNDNLVSDNPIRAILTGWPKSNNINRILSSFLFSELTVLFYHFENTYYNSLQRRNRKYNENIKTTIDSKGIHLEGESNKPNGFDDLYSGDEIVETTIESSFDIFNFELNLDNTQYSNYAAKGNLIDSIKAKRIDFENNFFIYSSEAHKFLVINELLENKGEKANLHRRRIEGLKPGNVIVFINTDRDILVDLVEKNTSKKELTSVKQWTELWKNLLKEYYASTGNDFKKLVDELRKADCTKHEVTIRTWLQDESKIGPDDNADLVSIAYLTNSNFLFDNIANVRDAISKMTGWRMKASDFITDKIKSQIHEFADTSIINKKISIDGLGSVIVLKVIEVSYLWENIDVRYVNKLLEKEIF